MLKIDIPGFHEVEIQNIVMDYNGTLACDGKLLSGVKELFKSLSPNLNLYVVTADTFGLAQSELEGLPCELTILPKENQAEGKLNFVKSLGLNKTVSIGNGRNDRLMINECIIGVVLLQEEGCSVETLINGDIISKNICDALGLLLNPKRLIASLRS